MADIRYDSMFWSPGGFNIQSGEPIDSRMYVKDITHIYLSDNWKSVRPYPGLIVSAPDGQVRIYVGPKYDAATPDIRPWETQSNWKEIGGTVQEITSEEINSLFT